MTKEEIGSILKELRIKSGKTQQEVADALGRKQQIIGHWETGYSQPDANTLFVLCQLYNASVDESFGFTLKGGITPLDENKCALIADYDQLNSDGQKRLTDYADDLVSSGKYIKTQTDQHCS